MSSFIRRASLIALAIMLTACASRVPLQRAQTSAISRESTPAQLDQALANATVVAQFEFVANDKPYFARHFDLLTGTRQEMTMVCTPNCFPIFITVPITSQYVVLQRLPTKAVHAWGTLEELSKDPDPEVSSIMPTVKLRFDDELKKKK